MWCPFISLSGSLSVIFLSECVAETTGKITFLPLLLDEIHNPFLNQGLLSILLSHLSLRREWQAGRTQECSDPEASEMGVFS